MNELKQAYSFTDFLFYVCLLAVPIFTAILGIGRYAFGWVAVFAILAGGMTALILKYYCTRCPHYTRDSPDLKCIFFWKLPKFFQPRPGALNMIDKLVLYAAPAVVLVFPLPWLFLQPGLLIIYILSLAGFAAAVRRNECGRCIYFACPMNPVDASAKEQYREHFNNE